MQQLVNSIRFYHYIAGVLVNQQSDPLCSSCRAAANTAAKMKEGITQLEIDCAANAGTIPASMAAMLAETLTRLDAMKFPGDLPGQKKAGNCKIPEGTCFVKSSKKLLENIGQ